MHVTHLSLENYRSYENLVAQFPRGPVVLYGRNGRGKTNVVEAIGYLSALTSHRVSGAKALIRNGESAAVLRAKVQTERESLIEIELVAGGANRARLNRIQCAPREVVGVLRTVTFAPEDVQILRGEPGLRRRLLDRAISQIRPSYAAVKRDFDRVLVQRSAALKEAARSGHFDVLDVWDSSLASLSGQINAQRLVMVESLRDGFIEAYARVSDDSKVAGISLSSSPLPEGVVIPLVVDGFFPDTTELSAQLTEVYLGEIEQRRPEEIRRRQNLVGAHRDDLTVTIDSMPVKGYASHGETWSAALALRMAQSEVFRIRDQTPVLILDDVFAELDAKRRLALAAEVANAEQVFITSAAKDDLPELEAAHFEVKWQREGGSTIGPG